MKTVGDCLRARWTTAGPIYYQYDNLGNVSDRLDANQAIVSSDLYDAYGVRQLGTSSDPYGYKGQYGYYTDRETGLILCTFRYYDPASGGWLTRDPIGYAGGINLYGYCEGDPVSWADTDGLAKDQATAKPPKQKMYCHASFVNGVGTLECYMASGPGLLLLACKARNITENMDGGDPNQPGSNRPAPDGTYPLGHADWSHDEETHGPYDNSISPSIRMIPIDIRCRKGICVHAGRFTKPTQGCIRVSKTCSQRLERLLWKYSGTISILHQ